MAVVKEIVEKLKEEIGNILPEYKALRYEYDINSNSDRDYKKRYGVTIDSANVVQNTIGFITMEHTFNVVLTNSFLNKDSDASKNKSLAEVYDAAEAITAAINCRKLDLASPTYNVLLISNLSLDTPEFLTDTNIIALRLNLDIRYKYRHK